jgi:hypothetical protein
LSAEPKRWISVTAPVGPVARVSRGTIKTDQHIAYPQGTPMTNLLLTLLDKVGVEVAVIGDSTGRLTPELHRGPCSAYAPHAKKAARAKRAIASRAPVRS